MASQGNKRLRGWQIRRQLSFAIAISEMELRVSRCSETGKKRRERREGHATELDPLGREILGRQGGLVCAQCNHHTFLFGGVICDIPCASTSNEIEACPQTTLVLKHPIDVSQPYRFDHISLSFFLCFLVFYHDKSLHAIRL